MNSLKKLVNYTGIAVLVIAFIVYFFSVERTGSLWDCGEFILGAYKLQVVHPPGAAIFILIGRIFTWIASVLSDDPANIAFSVNLMSGLCSALAAMFTAWSTMILGKIALKGRDEETTPQENLALSAAGLVAGLATAFSSSIWFSAVEGEVYAMSTFFTAMTFWAAVKWYSLPNTPDSDRWLVFSLFAGGLSTGVHLLSILSFPAIGLLYYYKKSKSRSLVGALTSLAVGVLAMIFVLKVVIVGIPTLWRSMELFMVNDLGLPFHSGLIPTVLILGALGYFALRFAHARKSQLLHLLAVSAILIVVAFSTIGVVVIRANADTPVNMNVPSDAMRLLPYLNREQYGERPLLSGPHYDAKPYDMKRTDRYGQVGDRYEVIDERYEYKYRNKDKIAFPRIGHTEMNRPELHKIWRKALNGNSRGKPTMSYNLQFLFKYQIGWMYTRYFMWNFAGRENGEQGFFPWDVSKGHWASGISALDEGRLFNMEEMTDTMKNDKANNKYYLLPLIFGLLGLLFHLFKDKKGFSVLFILFLITGIGIIIYSNQPPNEPRERDYVLVGSFMTFCMWIGMGVLAIFDVLRSKGWLKGLPAAGLAGVLVLTAPLIMGFENFDDHSRMYHTGARDYASNFLHSVDKDAIIFTYGDNDTYPLWYAQEVENIRRDVRVVNLSLIAVDWYINKLRNKVNDSPPIKLTLDATDYRGKNRNQVFFFNPNGNTNQPLDLRRALQIIGDDNNVREGKTIVPSSNFYLPVNLNEMKSKGIISPTDTSAFVEAIPISFAPERGYITKDDLAILDVIASNINDRPIYFAVTCKNEKLMGLNDYMEMEGLGLQIIPLRTPSDRSLAIYGSGRMDASKAYDNIMNSWRWGNFDKRDLYVDASYGAAIQAMKMVFIRTATTFLLEGNPDKAAEICNKYFEAFPHMNFAYDTSVTPFLNVLANAGRFDDVKKHMRILAEETAQRMRFYQSLDEDDFESFKQNFSFDIKSVTDILQISKRVEDPAFEKEMSDLVGQYNYSSPNLKN